MNSSLRPQRGQFLLIDVLKAIAAQVIVFHHLSIYGPISRDALASADLVQWLSDYGRYAVQVFLVLGGYLAMMTLPRVLDRDGLVKSLINRYLRLIPAFVVVMLLTVIAAFYTRQYLSDEFVGSPETFGQILAHVFLLHGILNIDSISAGAWYIAIDWQLYAVLAILISLFGKTSRLVLILVVLMLAAFFYFSKYQRLDVWMIYFIGSYGLGVLAYLISDGHNQALAKFAKVVGYFLALLLLVSILMGAGAKAVVALAVFLVLLASNLSILDMTFNHSSMWIEIIKWLSHRSYALFLIHYPFILLFNALYEKFNLSKFGLSLTMMWMVWGVSLIASNYLYQWVEKPCRKWQIH
jgi:peptidoglycan/LPS O-acetylase OafA/YrhL